MHIYTKETLRTVLRNSSKRISAITEISVCNTATFYYRFDLPQVKMYLTFIIVNFV